MGEREEDGVNTEESGCSIIKLYNTHAWSLNLMGGHWCMRFLITGK